MALTDLMDEIGRTAAMGNEKGGIQSALHPQSSQDPPAVRE